MSGSSTVTVTAVSASINSGTLEVGDTLTFTITPSAPVQVTSGPGGSMPELDLSNGAQAAYTGLDGNGALLFGYTVQPGQATSDLTVTGLDLNGATIDSLLELNMMGSLTPDITSATDGVPYEMGTEFKPLVDGSIDSVLFYKSPSETGSHVGHIWSASGTLLAIAIADFTNETDSGWQTAQLATPLPVQAGTDYVVTVGINSYYVDTHYGLANPVGSQYITTDGTSGGLYGPEGAFPTESWHQSNYFEDVGFQVNQPLDTSAIASLPGSDTGDTVACFRSGTRLSTASGQVAVENLKVGDLLLTEIGGGLSPIVWIGRRVVRCSRVRYPRKMWPVRIKAGAFGLGRPVADLWVSPDHALFLHGVLIPVRCLLDDHMIAQVEVDEITYYHVELPRHDVILAEGLPAESFLDTGGRRTFENGPGPVLLDPDFSILVWEAEGCAPLVVAGPEVEALRRQIGRRMPNAA